MAERTWGLGRAARRPLCRKGQLRGLHVHVAVTARVGLGQQRSHGEQPGQSEGVQACTPSPPRSEQRGSPADGSECISARHHMHHMSADREQRKIGNRHDCVQQSQRPQSCAGWACRWAACSGGRGDLAIAGHTAPPDRPRRAAAPHHVRPAAPAPSQPPELVHLASRGVMSRLPSWQRQPRLQRRVQ